MYPTYNYAPNECGIVHITIGTGGKPGIPAFALDNEPIDAGVQQRTIERVYPAMFAAKHAMIPVAHTSRITTCICLSRIINA
jgi:hypothetical protein